MCVCNLRLENSLKSRHNFLGGLQKVISNIYPITPFPKNDLNVKNPKLIRFPMIECYSFDAKISHKFTFLYHKKTNHCSLYNDTIPTATSYHFKHAIFRPTH